MRGNAPFEWIRIRVVKRRELFDSVLPGTAGTGEGLRRPRAERARECERCLNCLPREGNCSGLIAVDTSAGGPPDEWIQGYAVHANTAACTPSDDLPLPLSGLGIARSARAARPWRPTASRVTARRSTRRSAAASCSPRPGPSTAARRRTRSSAATTLRANTPADLVYDGSGQNNRLTGNGCETSVPDGLCR
jgi:hypothetical protein